MSTQGGPNVRRPGAILETSLKRGRIFSFPLISSHLLPFRSVGRYWLRGRVGFGLGRGGNPGLIVIMVEGCHPGWEGPSVSSLIAAEGAETAAMWAALPQRGTGLAGLPLRPAAWEPDVQRPSIGGLIPAAGGCRTGLGPLGSPSLYSYQSLWLHLRATARHSRAHKCSQSVIYGLPGCYPGAIRMKLRRASVAV